MKTYKITTYREDELPKQFNYVLSSTQRKLDAIKISNSVPPANYSSSHASDSNVVWNIANPVPSIGNAVSSPAVKNVNLNQIINNDNVIGNNAHINPIGKYPVGWIPQNVSMANQSGFNRGNSVPRNTLNSNNALFNNK